MKSILSDLKALRDSCNEGISGEWDGSPEGFEAMLSLIDRIEAYIRKECKA